MRCANSILQLNYFIISRTTEFFWLFFSYLALAKIWIPFLDTLFPYSLDPF